MTGHHLSCGSRHSPGFSLIEMMVSLVIGLIISIAAFSAYLGASGAAKIAEAQQRMNEDSQAALTILTQQLRMAGNNPKQPNGLDNPDLALSRLRNPVYLQNPLKAFAILGCEGGYLPLATGGSLDTVQCAAATIGQPDSIAITYEADIYNTLPTATWIPTDCLGNPLSKGTNTFSAIPGTPGIAASPASPATYYMADNRFYIGTSATILSPSLYCKGNGNGSTAQPMVENIEDMQFTYGTVQPPVAPNLVNIAPVAGYLTASEVLSNSNLTGLPNDAARWANVVTVRICVVVRSALPVVSDAVSARYFKCDGTLETAPRDLRLRRAYSTTIALRNRRLIPPEP